MSEKEIPEVTMDTITFSRFAQDAGWDDRTIELLIKPPIYSFPFFCGQKTKRKRVTLIAARALEFRK